MAGCELTGPGSRPVRRWGTSGRKGLSRNHILAYLSLAIVENGLHVGADAERLLGVEDHLIRRIVDAALVASPNLKSIFLNNVIGMLKNVAKVPLLVNLCDFNGQEFKLEPIQKRLD